MGKRYYCDYCDRSFQDTLHNRKKHLNGVQHQRAKKAWFDHFKGAAAILQEERNKQLCRKFIQTGQCVFGSSCRYSHMSEHELKLLEQHAEDEKRQKDVNPDPKKTTEPSLSEWLTKREKKKAATATGSGLKLAEQRGEEESNDVPPFLLSIPDLPPSLLPLQPGSQRVTVYTDWG